MHLSRRAVLGALVVIGLACSEGNAPPVPSGISLTSGNNQAGLPGATLALPLTVTVTGAGGAPFPNARVVWSVSTGSAALTPTVDTTDANGVATTSVTVGVVPGNLVVTAAVTGVSPVLFQLQALDPCTNRVSLSNDTTANGVMTNFDCAVFVGSSGPYFTDVYSISLPAQMSLQISMNATALDAYVDQYHSNGAFIAFNDDVDSTQTNPNSRYHLIAGAGTYYLGASTFGEGQTGPYTITVGPRAQTLTGCSDDFHRAWVTRGVALADQVEATDCTTTRIGGGRAYGDRVLVVLTPTRGLSASLASAAFNPRLELYELPQSGGRVLRGAADGAAGTAALNFTPTAPGFFRLEMTSVDTVQTGAYTLTIGGAVPNVAEVIALPLPGSSAPRPRRGLETKRP